MKSRIPSALQASFGLTRQERKSLLIILALLLFGIITRHFYLKNEPLQVYTPAEIEDVEPLQ